MAGTRLTIHLEVEGEADSPRGRIRDDDTGATRRFLGWLGLVSAVDALISGVPRTASTDVEWPENELTDRG